MNECEFASKIKRWWSYRSWSFAYFKLFPWWKYTAGPDWSKRFVKPMNINFALEAERKLVIFTYGRFVNKGVGSKWRHGTEKKEEECKRPWKQAPTRHQPLQRNDMSASAKAAHRAHCFWRNFVLSFIQNDFCTSRRDFSRRKQNKGVSFIQNDISRRKQNRGVRVS